MNSRVRLTQSEDTGVAVPFYRGTLHVASDGHRSAAHASPRSSAPTLVESGEAFAHDLARELRRRSL